MRPDNEPQIVPEQVSIQTREPVIEPTNTTIVDSFSGDLERPLDPTAENDSDVWACIAEQGYTEGVSLAGQLGDTPLLVLGDTNHANVAIQRGIIDSLMDLKEVGATHLALEIPEDYRGSAISEVARGTRLPHCYEELINTATSLGLIVEYIDLATEDQNQYSDSTECSSARGKHMGEKLSEILKSSEDAKVVAIVGYAHLREQDEIPGVLAREGVTYKGVACATKGQHLMMPHIGKSFIEIPVTAGITKAHPESSSGYLDLSDIRTMVDGVMMFSRPLPKAIQARPLQQLSSEETGVIDNIPSVLGNINLSSAISMSYAHCEMVEPSSTQWSVTNQAKILDCISAFVDSGEMGSSQGVYLATLLSAYANSTGRHSLGGSVVQIGFVPEGQYFEITTVDTMGYKYKPKTDYSAKMTHHEVSIERLIESFGYIEGMEDPHSLLSKLSVKNNPSISGSLLRFVPYALVGSVDPDRLAIYSYFGSGHELRVYYTNKIDPSSSYISSLSIEDFELSSTEEKFMNLDEEFSELSKMTSSLKYDNHIASIAYEKPTLLTRILRRDKKSSLDKATIEKYSSMGRNYRPVADILKARLKMRSLNKDEAKQLLQTFDQAFDEVEVELSAIKRLTKNRTDIRSHPLEDDHQTAGKAKSLGEKIDLTSKQLQKIKAEVDEMRKLVS